jgi:hypothetical protein
VPRCRARAAGKDSASARHRQTTALAKNYKTRSDRGFGNININTYPGQIHLESGGMPAWMKLREAMKK